MLDVIVFVQVLAHHFTPPSYTFFLRSAGEDEITFDPDDIIEDIEKVDEGWWIGSCRGQRGLFPSNYVEAL